MKKTYKIEIDCANCANKVEEEINKIDGVSKAVVNFMMLNVTIDFKENADINSVLKEIKTKGKKIDSDFEIYL